MSFPAPHSYCCRYLCDIRSYVSADTEVHVVWEMTTCRLYVSTGVLDANAGVYIIKPTGHVMHQQFNIQQLHVLPTLYLCVLYLSENKQRLVPLIA